MKVIHADGRCGKLLDDGTERPWCWYDSLNESFWRWWHGRPFARRQREFSRTKTRYYGDGGTIHSTGHLDIETDALGNVVSVWFRCQLLPFQQHRVEDERAREMKRAYESPMGELRGVEIRDARAIQ